MIYWTYVPGYFIGTSYFANPKWNFYPPQPASLSRAPSLQWHWAFLIVQLPHPYMTTGKTIALTRWTTVSKVTSLLFNMLSRLVIPFLPRSKQLLISWLQSPSAVILEPPKIKSDNVYNVSSSICHEVMGLDAMILLFWKADMLTTIPPTRS